MLDFTVLKKTQVTALIVASFIVGEGGGPIKGSFNQKPVSQSHAVQPSPS